MKHLISPTERHLCSGCTACATACPRRAITMEADKMGFLYPSVDEAACTDCGLCEKVCPIKVPVADEGDAPECHAARHQEMTEVEKSRSGAVFVALTDHVLKQGGVVYGAVLTDDLRVVHQRATIPGQRDAMRGSKYVQSDMRGIYTQVLQDLKAGLRVLFSGTPCQTAGLLRLVNAEQRSRLLLVDVVCHGVPGPNVWHDYLKLVEQNGGQSVVAVDFRDKQLFGWNRHRETFRLSGSEKKHFLSRTFYNEVPYRPSCSHCPYARVNRPSDLTIGDFWGWQKVLPQANADNRGLNLVLLHTQAGRDLFQAVAGRLKVWPVPLNAALQPNLQAPTAPMPRQEEWEASYAEVGLQKTLRRFSAPLRVGLLTFHRAYNYGAVLQCYALQQVLRELGHEVVLIDYRQPEIDAFYRAFRTELLMKRRGIKNKLRYLKEYPQRRRLMVRRRAVFHQFLAKHFTRSKQCDAQSVPRNLDAYVIGSDQLWNHRLTGDRFDPVYLGAFIHRPTAKVIGYAISTNAKSLDQMEQQGVVNQLANFHHLSLREEEAVTRLQSHTDLPLAHCIDPTLLTDSQMWSDMTLTDSPWAHRRYVLHFSVRRNKEYEAYIQRQMARLRQQYGEELEIIDLRDLVPTVEEFVTMFRYASHVITSSFHATVFSLIFQRPIHSIALGDASDMRYTGLLTQVGAADRIVPMGQDITLTPMDYTDVQPRLARLRQENLDFLRHALS